MRKEDLMNKKKEIVELMPWEFQRTLTDNDIRAFSRAQLEMLVDIMNRANKKKEESSPFFTLSATEVIQKSTGKIAQFLEGGGVSEETIEDIMSGASSWIYSEYTKKTSVQTMAGQKGK